MKKKNLKGDPNFFFFLLIKKKCQYQLKNRPTLDETFFPNMHVFSVEFLH